MFMNRIRLSLALVAVIAGAAIAVIVSTAGGTTNKAQRAAAANSAISVTQTSLGKVLTDADGRTLYLFAGDKPNLSTLSAAGRAYWPPFTATTRPSATSGALTGEIGAIPAGSGTAQVTYNGHPLYYFVGDQRPGQTAGQGLNQFGAHWYVLSSAGAAIISAPKASAPSTSTSDGSGYGY
jgi:predicted lipoprotein with Yx(FWY)xxD motif